MSLTNRAEEILETLWTELVEKKREKCNVGILKNDLALVELEKGGYVKLKNNNLSLTSKGKEGAKSCVRRHRLAERLLVDVLDVKKTSAHDPGCKFEHLLHKGLDEHICTLLGHPKTCPHGRPIPQGECCQDAKRMPKKLLMPLSQLKTNKKARIAYLQTNDRQALQKVIAMGALPHADILLVQRFPSYMFQIGKTQFAIDEELAECIYVRTI